jgi:uncharacterized protein
MPIIKCPNCGRETEYHGNEFRPFCSERCKLIDLGAWADERYSLPVEGESMTEEDLQALERTLASKTDDKE